MVLELQSPAHHNKSLGLRIPHPPSTNFEEDGFNKPSAKRLKRFESTDSSLSRRPSDDDEKDAAPPSPLLRPSSRIKVDSEVESDDDEELSANAGRTTELESALPPIRTDKDAIAEYEATRAAEAQELALQDRLGQRKWVQGKSSIYVDAFNLALETVLADESHLFDDAEMAVFEHWRALRYEAQYLYVITFVV